MPPDLVVTDREGQPLLVVEVRWSPAGHQALALASASMKTAGSPAGGPVPFGMVVDPEVVRVYRAVGGRVDLLGLLPTDELLRRYDRHFTHLDTSEGTKSGLRFYLTGMASVWLEDLIDPWKPGAPPVMDRFEESGLLQRLHGATVVEQGLVRDDPLR